MNGFCFRGTLFVVSLASLLLIFSPNNAKAQADEGGLIKFDVTEKANVYVLYDSRGVGKGEPSINNKRGYLPPSWLDSNFVQLQHEDGSPVQVCTNDYGNLIPYRRTFDAGVVRLGGNQTDMIQELGQSAADKDVAMYIAAAAPSDGKVDDSKLITNIEITGETDEPDAYKVNTSGIAVGNKIYGADDVTTSIIAYFADEGHDPGRSCDEDPIPDELEGISYIQTSGNDEFSDEDLSYKTDIARGVHGAESSRLGEAYPNPLTHQTHISFTLARPTQAELAIYDLLGRRVATLVDRHMQAGTHEVTWDGAEGGRLLPAGVYFYRLRAGDFTETYSLAITR